MKAFPINLKMWFRSLLLGLLAYVGLVCCVQQQASAQNTAFQLQQFRPWGDPKGVLITQSGETLGQWNYFVGLYLNYAKDPLTFRGANAVTSVMSDQLGADVLAGVGLLSWLDVTLAIPMTLYQVGTIPNATLFEPTDRGKDLTGFAMSDLKLQIKMQALREKRHIVNLGFQVFVSLPTGDKEKMGGEDPVSFGVKAFLSKNISIVNLGLNLGYRFLPPTTLGALKVQHELTYSLGASIRVWKPYLDVLVDIGGATAISDQTTLFAAPLELYVGVRGYPLGNENLALTLGASFAITSGYGAPLARVLFGVMWAPQARDQDGDGLSDDKDRCPKRAGPRANQGCPWGDTDGDGLKDNVDKCPKKAGPKENQGCPWGDTDGDGVNDNEDKCPKTPGAKDNRGCPWGDADKDGLSDNIDKCPKQAGPKANKGCPWGDSDNDGLKDNEDKCPKKAGPKENQGCPDTDRDNDGIVDRLDKCPDVPGSKKRQGCPRKVLVVVRKTGIKILQRIRFRTGSATILRRSYSILNQVVSVLKSRSKLRIRIEGHTDNVGRKRYNLRLSKRRAASVKRYLIRKGVDASRLESEGYGMSKPLVRNNSRRNRALNRRVQFTILK